jgi:hypothetical protein
MTESEDQGVSAREGFEYAYKLFIEAIEILAQEPADQVRSNGNYNTAFELLWSASGGLYMIDSPASYLTDEQQLAVRDFISETANLPFKRHSGRQDEPDVRLDSNLTDMLHPSWVTIRASAKRLLLLLASATVVNEAYFSSL